MRRSETIKCNRPSGRRGLETRLSRAFFSKSSCTTHLKFLGFEKWLSRNTYAKESENLWGRFLLIKKLSNFGFSETLLKISLTDFANILSTGVNLPL